MNTANYQQIEKIHSSDRCNVYRAVDATDGTPIVLKELVGNDSGGLHNEVRVCREVEHDVKAGMVVFGGGFALVRSYKNGQMLADFIPQTTFHLDWFFGVVFPLIESLEKLHQAGLLHKDLNPSNILLNTADGTISIIDFDLSSFLKTNELSLAPVSFLEGTLAYIAPEQTGRMNRHLDYRSDYYALGVTFYEMLCGTTPFVSDDPLTLIHSHLAQQPVPPHERNRQIPTVLSAIVLKLLAKNAEDRYQSLHGLEADLHRCQQDLLHQRADWFELGQMDSNGQLNISQKLYGRQREVQLLLDAYAQTEQGQKAIVTVAGHSGVGKSRLVQELYKPISGSKGLFLSGHFDPLQRQVPFMAWSQAFEQFADWVLSESKETQDFWRKSLNEALQGLGSILTQLVPRLTLLLGEQASLPNLGGGERQQSLLFALNAFVKCLCDAAPPLVLFLDDWQWADDASIRLFKSISTNNDITKLLLVVAYRDNETGTQHPFTLAMNEIEKAYPFEIKAIGLKSLAEDGINALVADSLLLDLETSNTLANLVQAKTRGNAFAVHNFLQTIYHDKLLTYHFETNCWTWSLEQIRAKYVNDDVVKIISDSLSNRSEASLKSVKTASAIGLEFSIDDVAALENRTSEAVHQDLWPLIQEGWLVPKDNNYRYVPAFYEEQQINVTLFFAHARIQQAVYEQLNEAEKLELHYQLGQALLQENNQDIAQLSTEKLFAIARHLSVSYVRSSESAQQQQFAEVLLQAGKRAYENTAFDIAQTYLEQALPFLKKSLPERSLAEVYRLLVESAYLSNQEATMEQIAQEALGLFKQHWERSLIYDAQINCYAAANKMEQAIEVSRVALDELGISIPQKAKTWQIIWSVMLTQRALPNKKIGEVHQWPLMQDEKALSAMQVLSSALIPYFFENIQTYPLLLLQMVRLSARYGICEKSVLGFGSYGLILAGSLKKPESGYQAGKQALLMRDRLQSEKMTPQACFVEAMFIGHWKEPWQPLLQLCQEGYLAGLRVGNLSSAGWNAYLPMFLKFVMGYNLEQLRIELIDVLKFQQQNRQFKHIEVTLFILRSVETILGVQSEDSFGSVANIMQRATTNNRLDEVVGFYVHEFIQAVVLEEWEKAWNNCCNAWVHRNTLISSVYMPVMGFYQALAGIHYWAELSDQSAKKSVLKKIKETLSVLDLYTQLNPITRKIFYDFVILELAHAQKPQQTSNNDYPQIIQVALQSNFQMIAALAAVHYGQKLRTQNQPQAEQWFRQAEEIYRNLKAKSYADFVHHKYVGQAKDTTNVTSFGRSGGLSAAGLDAMTLVKTASSLSSEIKLDRLLEQLMRYAAENAGAENGAFILSRNHQYSVELEIVPGRENTFRFVRLPLEKSQLVSESAVNYAISTGQAVVLNDASREAPFSSDAYVIKNGIKSVMCIPFAHKNAIKGLIYLENNLTTGAFNKQRIELITLLAGQVAVSIENAMLYENLENLVAQRTEQLEEEKQKSERLLRNILPETIADELKADGRSKARYYENASVLFADIKNFTLFAEKENPTKLVEELDYCFKAFDVIIARYDIEKIKTIGDAYFCVSGLPIANQDHAQQLVAAALDIQDWMAQETRQRAALGQSFFGLRVGIHTGAVVAGVVGNTKFAYDVWGDTVNTGARMEQYSEVGRVNISEATHALVKTDFDFEHRGEIEAKNKGLLNMYFVNRQQPSVRTNSTDVTMKQQPKRYDALKDFVINKLSSKLLPNLTYHGVHHTQDVLAVCEAYINRLQLPAHEAELLRVGALLHDIGFLDVYQLHEEKGVEMADEILPQFGYTADEIATVAGLIRATKVPQLPQNELEKIICDADLDYLGRTDFNPISESLFQELQNVGILQSRLAWDNIQVKFLEGHCYQTDFAVAHRQPQKAARLAEIKARIG